MYKAFCRGNASSRKKQRSLSQLNPRLSKGYRGSSSAAAYRCLETEGGVELKRDAGKASWELEIL